MRKFSQQGNVLWSSRDCRAPCLQKMRSLSRHGRAVGGSHRAREACNMKFLVSVQLNLIEIVKMLQISSDRSCRCSVWHSWPSPPQSPSPSSAPSSRTISWSTVSSRTWSPWRTSMMRTQEQVQDTFMKSNIVISCNFSHRTRTLIQRKALGLTLRFCLFLFWSS